MAEERWRRLFRTFIVLHFIVWTLLSIVTQSRSDSGTRHRSRPARA